MELLRRGRDAAVAGRARARASWPASGSPSRAPSTRSSAGAGATSRSASSASSVRPPSRSPRRWATSPWRSWPATASSSSPRPTCRCAASGSRASSPAPACPRACCSVVHGHTDAGAALVAAPVAQIRFTGSARAGREVGEACARGAQALGARRSTARTRCSCSPTPTSPRAVRGAAWAAFANAGQCGGIGRARAVRARGPRSLPRRRRRSGAAPARRRPGGSDDVDRPARRPRARRARARAGRRGRRRRRDAALRRPAASGAALRAGRAQRRDAGDAPGARGGARPGARGRGGRIEEEAIARANEATLGLGASVWTADRYKGARIARELRVGMVWMNDHLVARSAPADPVGRRRRRGHRPRARRHRPAHVRRAERRHLGPADRAPGVVVPLRRRLVGAARAVAGLRSARDRDRERAWRRDGLALLRVTGRWLRAMRRGICEPWIATGAHGAARARSRRARSPPRRCWRSRPAAAGGPRGGWRRPRRRARPRARGRRRRRRSGASATVTCSPAAAPPTSLSGRCSPRAATSRSRRRR